MKVAEMLREFHEHPNMVDTESTARESRYALHREEHRELEMELRFSDGWDRRRIARELADEVYTAYGTAHVFGIDLGAALAEVHRCAMEKAEANVRRDGRLMKPPGFVAPNMAGAVPGGRAAGDAQLEGVLRRAADMLYRTGADEASAAVDEAVRRLFDGTGPLAAALREAEAELDRLRLQTTQAAEALALGCDSQDAINILEGRKDGS